MWGGRMVTKRMSMRCERPLAKGVPSLAMFVAPGDTIEGGGAGGGEGAMALHSFSFTQLKRESQTTYKKQMKNKKGTSFTSRV